MTPREATERASAELALEASEERFRALVQNSSDVVLILDERLHVTYVSSSFTPLSGRETDGVLGADAVEFIHPDDRDEAAAALLPVFKGPGAAAEARFRVPLADGRWRWLDATCVNLLDNPHVAGIVCNLRDVTERVTIEKELRESEERFRALVRYSPVGISRHDSTGTCVFVNERWMEITGLTFEEAIGEGWRQLVHPDDAAVLSLGSEGGTLGEDSLPAEFRIVRPDGSVRWVAARNQPMHDETGQPTGSIGSLADVTDRMEAQRDAQRLIDIFEATHDVVGIADRDGALLYFNAAARRFFGLPPHGGLEGFSLVERFTPDMIERLIHEVQPALERDGMWYGELNVLRGDGHVVPVLAQLLIHTDENGDFEFFSGILHDISARKQFESQLAHQATHDPLTGLPNRILLLERLGHALERARKHHKRVAVLFLDLDHFKVVNDSLGHGVGDRLLLSIAERLKTVVRPSDTIARFGGDEFVVLCEDLDDRSDAIAVAERVNKVISGSFELDEAEVFVGVSIGIAFPDDPDADPGTLIRDADAAMYRAKERGRARWEVFDNAMRAHAVDRLDIENALRRAQERRELRVFYQPVISLAGGSVVGVEALLRWEHPERGLLLPEDFIQIAEETGLIVPIGGWVLDQACRQIQRWQASLPDHPPLRLSVNLSGRQLGHPGLVAHVRDVIAETSIEPSLLELEITESVLMDDVDMSEDTLGQLKDIGVKLAVDDFGTGYSSLSYLRRFPVDVLKVDQSFVDGLGNDPSDSAIVAAIVTLAHTLGLQAVAEGVETSEQLAELRRLGCDLAQGFWMARPANSHDIGDLLATVPSWRPDPEPEIA